MSDLRDIFVGGLGAWVDSQRYETGTVNNPVPYTQDGQAGSSQATSYSQVLNSPIVIGGAILLAALLVIVAVKK